MRGITDYFASQINEEISDLRGTQVYGCLSAAYFNGKDKGFINSRVQSAIGGFKALMTTLNFSRRLDKVILLPHNENGYTRTKPYSRLFAMSSCVNFIVLSLFNPKIYKIFEEDAKQKQSDNSNSDELNPVSQLEIPLEIPNPIDFENSLNQWASNKKNGTDRKEIAEKLLSAYKEKKEVLYLCNLKIRSLPSCINQLDSVKKLNLSYCGMKSIPEQIFNLKNLTTLELACNQLTEIDRRLTLLNHLKELVLSGNQIESISDNLVFPKLTKLDLGERLIPLAKKEIAPLAVDFQKRWREYEIQQSLKNWVMEGPEEERKSRLKACYILLSTNKGSSCPLRGLGLTSLPSCLSDFSFEDLDLSENLLTDLPSGFIELDSLKSLNLRNNLIHDQSNLACLNGLTKLTTLYLNENKSLKKLPPSLRPNTSMKNLVIDENVSYSSEQNSNGSIKSRYICIEGTLAVYPFQIKRYPWLHQLGRDLQIWNEASENDLL